MTQFVQYSSMVGEKPHCDADEAEFVRTEPRFPRFGDVLRRRTAESDELGVVPALFLRLTRSSARTSLLLHSQTAAMVLYNITCGSAMLVNTQGVITVQRLTLLPGSLFNVGTNERG